jgi:hypothetical protein
MMVAGGPEQVGLHIGGEHAQRTSRHRNSAVGMVACTAAVYLGQTSQKPWHEFGIAEPLGQESQIVSNGGQAVDARPALSGAFLGEEASETC